MEELLPEASTTKKGLCKPKVVELNTETGGVYLIAVLKKRAQAMSFIYTINQAASMLGMRLVVLSYSGKLSLGEKVILPGGIAKCYCRETPDSIELYIDAEGNMSWKSVLFSGFSNDFKYQIEKILSLPEGCIEAKKI